MTATAIRSDTIDKHAATLAELEKFFGSGVFTCSTFLDQTRIHVPADRAFEILARLKQSLGFAMLVELGGVDYLGYPGRSRPRYEIVYIVLNLDTTERLIVRAALADSPSPEIASVVSLWPGANWMEREVYDMYGVRFLGHPDLRRILMPEEFTAFPLRKDYPLRGRGERHNFTRIARSDS